MQFICFPDVIPLLKAPLASLVAPEAQGSLADSSLAIGKLGVHSSTKSQKCHFFTTRETTESPCLSRSIAPEVQYIFRRYTGTESSAIDRARLVFSLRMLYSTSSEAPTVRPNSKSWQPPQATPCFQLESMRQQAITYTQVHGKNFKCQSNPTIPKSRPSTSSSRIETDVNWIQSIIQPVDLRGKRAQIPSFAFAATGSRHLSRFRDRFTTVQGFIPLNSDSQDKQFGLDPPPFDPLKSTDLTSYGTGIPRRTNRKRAQVAVLPTAKCGGRQT
ncbi:hypothetical protein V8F20_001152 [Naviculisporaceae sp. PSN 640]